MTSILKEVRDWHECMENVREERNRLLKNEIDTMSPIRWRTLSAVEKEKWCKYRQELLDVPQQDGFPFNVVWPRLWDNEMAYANGETYEKLFY